MVWRRDSAISGSSALDVPSLLLRQGDLPQGTEDSPGQLLPGGHNDTFRTVANVSEDASEEATGTMETTNHYILFRVSGFTRIPPKSQAPVLVHSQGGRLMYVVSHEHVTRKHMAMPVRGVVYVLPTLPGRLLVSNVSQAQ